jgi:hypothetical protein
MPVLGPPLGNATQNETNPHEDEARQKEKTQVRRPGYETEFENLQL